MLLERLWSLCKFCTLVAMHDYAMLCQCCVVAIQVLCCGYANAMHGLDQRLCRVWVVAVQGLGCSCVGGPSVTISGLFLDFRHPQTPRTPWSSWSSWTSPPWLSPKCLSTKTMNNQEYQKHQDNHKILILSLLSCFLLLCLSYLSSHQSHAKYFLFYRSPAPVSTHQNHQEYH